MENLTALVYGTKLTAYQKGLAMQEFEEMKQSNKDANKFIIDIAGLLNMNTDGVGYDDIQFSIDDFKDAISTLANKQLRPFRQFCKDNYSLDIPDRIVDEFERYGSLSNKSPNVSDSLHIDFACYLTGHDRETIEQMYNDWRR